MGGAASLISALLPFMGSGGGAFAFVLVIYVLKRDRRKDALKDDANERSAFVTMVATLRRELDAANRDLEAQRSARQALELDRDRGWDLARWWRNKAAVLWSQFHDLIVGLPPSGYTIPAKLPGLEEPIPRT